jgi:ubiquinol-cytochrome c reductase cytochrome c1 subunit
MFFRQGKPSDKFKSPYPNEQAATAANGGAYPPDMSVLVKARKGGANYIYSVLVGYEDPPLGVKLDDGVYYNKYMVGNKIKMPNNLIDGLVDYSDGTESSMDQMAKDVTTFLAWAAEPELEIRHKTGIKVMIYLLLLTALVYLSMKKIWSRIDPKI